MMKFDRKLKGHLSYEMNVWTKIFRQSIYKKATNISLVVTIDKQLMD